MAIVEEYADIAAALRRIQAERASQEHTEAPRSETGPYATVRAIQIAIRSGRLLPRREPSEG